MEISAQIVSIAVLAIAVTFIVLVVVMIVALIEVRKLATFLMQSVTSLETQLPPALEELRQLSVNMRKFSEGVASRTDDVKLFMASLGNAGRSISRASSIISDVTGVVSKSTLWITGLKAASRFVINRVIKKGR